MSRPVTLFTGQWADLPITTMADKASNFGYDGLELACWGDHFEVDRALTEDDYCNARLEMLSGYGLGCWSISNHLVGQAVCDRIDHRHKSILPPHIWGDGDPKGVQQRAVEEMKKTARAAQKLGVPVVNGFTGSDTWGMWYSFPPTSQGDVNGGYDHFAEMWGPILDVFRDCGVQFALEIHPGEIAYDSHSAARALEAVGNHESFGFNFDPSHLVWQGVDPVKLIERFHDRIYHVHMKDVTVKLDGTSGILGSHLPFGDPRRGWDFRSVGRGDVDFDGIIRALNRIGYNGPLSVEWEDPDMDREHGAIESCEYVRSIDFDPTGVAFDDAFQKEG